MASELIKLNYTTAATQMDSVMSVDAAVQTDAASLNRMQVKTLTILTCPALNVLDDSYTGPPSASQPA